MMMTEGQHSANTINRQHVITSSLDFLIRQVANQRLHTANLLAKTGDTDSFQYLQLVFKDIEECLKDIKEDSLAEVKSYYEQLEN